MKHIFLGVMVAFVALLSVPSTAQPLPTSDQHYKVVPNKWDEAVPLGNAFLGALVWQKNSETLRMSLDRIDLWDTRPSDSIVTNPKTFEWVYNKVLSNDYGVVQQKYDASYESNAAPSKIPGAALEFNIAALGEVADVRLRLENATCKILWKSGASLETFVHASNPVGWFVFDNVESNVLPQIIAPTYNKGAAAGASTEGQDLGRLGYQQGTVTTNGNTVKYHQKGWGEFYYDVAVRYERVGKKLIGVWSITSSLSGGDVEKILTDALAEGIAKQQKSHGAWWSRFWSQSSVTVPDPVIQKQYDNEMYKLGSLTRKDGSIIPLQGVWTADNGKLPPWKGDVHHDLNTELSYWPVYTGNHLEDGYSMISTLWNQRETNRRFTKQFFGIEGINVPGVATIKGEPMGGWIQYSFSPSTASWLAHHFYLHWRYSMDREYLKNICYPYVKEVATFVANFSKVNDKGERVFPLSSSPEIYDNSVKAWFRTMTNYDLALAKSVFNTASELARELGMTDQAAAWAAMSRQTPDYALSPDKSLAFAKGHPFNASHRHFSNAMAIYPLGLLDVANSENDKEIVDATIGVIRAKGSDYWTGYSFTWMANMQARSYDGQGAVQSLQDFANYFCLSNTFHANGDQKKSGRSLFTYRPFTLEGNMAFASGLQEMLLQSHRGYIEVFPAIPTSWRDLSFSTLRAQGAFLVSAKCEAGEVVKIEVVPEVGGVFALKNPMKFGNIKGAKLIETKGDITRIQTVKGKKFTIEK